MNSGGDASASPTPFTGGENTATAVGAASAWSKQIQVEITGAASCNELESVKPLSIVPQLSEPQWSSLEAVFESEQQPKAESIPIASIPQCSVAGSQRANSRTAIMC